MALYWSCFCAVILITIDKGDGRWKASSKEKLEEDIKAFRKITENIKQEIVEFYKDSSEINLSEKNNNKNIDIPRDVSYNWNNKEPLQEINEIHLENFIPLSRNLSHERQGYIKERSSNYKSDNKENVQQILWPKIDGNSGIEFNRSDWPKFDDLLLSMGKKYDWKNDRWIKVKEKKLLFSPSSKDNRMVFFSKHKFSYKSVKLNKSKAKRNLVIAVSAVR